MDAIEWRILDLTVRLFARLEWAERRWLLERLTADHRALLKEERLCG